MLTDTLSLSVSAIERAFQLARSGRVLSVKDIRLLLKREGYSTEDLTGRAIGDQLRALIAEAK